MNELSPDIRDLSEDEIRNLFRDLVDARIRYIGFLTSGLYESRFLHIPVGIPKIGQWTDPQLSLLYSFGMPDDIDLVLYNMPGEWFGTKYTHFTLEVFGVAGTLPADIHRHSQCISNTKKLRSHIVHFPDLPTNEVHAGAYLDIASDNKSSLPIQVWRTRVFMSNSNIYLEDLWHGRHRTWFRRIENIPMALDYTVIAAQVKEFATALSLPMLLQPRTRGDALSEEEFRKLGLETVKKLAPTKRTLSVRAFAKGMGYDRGTITKYITKYPDVWPSLLEEFQKLKT